MALIAAEEGRHVSRFGGVSARPSDLASGGRLDVPMSYSNELPVNYRETPEPVRRLENPLGEAAARYLALSQPQPVARKSQAPQGPTFLEQSEEYRRKAKALHEAGLRKQTANTPVPAPAPTVRTVEPAISDDFLRFAFQRFREAMAHARTPAQRAHLVKELDQVKQRMAYELVKGPKAVKHEDGYIMIGDMAYGTQEAYAAALKDLDYFQARGRHLPLQYPIHDYRPGDDIRLWPDVTDKVKSVLNGIEKEIKDDEKKNNVISFLNLFYENFPNNKSWDLQVNHGLPGQVALKDQKTGNYILTPEGFVKTVDQKARFKNRIVRAGYISNYAYGYAAAATILPAELAVGIAEGLSVFKKGELDTWDEIEAIYDGYRDYKYKN